MKKKLFSKLFGSRNSKPSPSVDKRQEKMFDTEISEDFRSKMKWKGEGKKGANSTQGEKPDDAVAKITVVELFDKSGEKIVFELLDTVEFEGNKYCLLTPYYETEEEYDLESPADVFILKEVLDKKTGEGLLESVEDKDLLQTIYGVFKDKHADKFTFRDS